MNWLRKHKNAILITIIVGFVISTFVGFGLYLGTESNAMDAVVEVNDEKIPYRQFTMFYNRIVNARRDQGESITPEILNQVKQDVIQSLIRESVFYQEAKRYGIQVTDAELAQSLTAIPAFQKEGKFDIQSYAQALQFGLKATPEEFEQTQRRQIAISRLQAFVTQGVKITNRELEQEFALQQAIKNDPKTKSKPKTPEELQKEKEKFREQLRQEKGSHVLNRWYQQLSTNLQVKVHLEEIEKRNVR